MKHRRGPSTPRHQALCHATNLCGAPLRMTILFGGSWLDMQVTSWFSAPGKNRTGPVIEKLRAAWGNEASPGFLRLRSGQALRLRAIKPSVCDRSAKRFAQDDDSVWGLA